MLLLVLEFEALFFVCAKRWPKSFADLFELGLSLISSRFKWLYALSISRNRPSERSNETIRPKISGSIT